MAFTTNSSGPMSDINVTPLVDVMLVLLIIFMITAPVLAHKIKVDQSGAFYWNDAPVDELGLKAQFNVISQRAESEQPEIQIAADDGAAYQYVATVLADAKSYNLVKIGFTEVQ